MVLGSRHRAEAGDGCSKLSKNFTFFSHVKSVSYFRVGVLLSNYQGAMFLCRNILSETLLADLWCCEGLFFLTRGPMPNDRYCTSCTDFSQIQTPRTIEKIYSTTLILATPTFILGDSYWKAIKEKLFPEESTCIKMTWWIGSSWEGRRFWNMTVCTVYTM